MNSFIASFISIIVAVVFVRYMVDLKENAKSAEPDTFGMREIVGGPPRQTPPTGSRVIFYDSARNHHEALIECDNPDIVGHQIRIRGVVAYYGRWKEYVLYRAACKQVAVE